jgi:hypothetical protein
MNRLRVQFAKNLIKHGCIKKACLKNLHLESGFSTSKDLEAYFLEFEGLTIQGFIQSITT